MGDEPTYARRSARVLLVDGAGRILLFALCRDPRRPDLGVCWLTPGGGVEDGETLPEAAARELLEEVGVRVAPHDLGSPVAQTSGYADLGWLAGRFHDTFFLHRHHRGEIDTSGLDETEGGQIVAHRWWTLDELRSATDDVYPLRLADLLADLLAGQVPSEPVNLPWHH